MRRTLFIAVGLSSLLACSAERTREPRRPHEKLGVVAPPVESVAEACRAYVEQTGPRRLQQYDIDDPAKLLCAMTESGSLQCAGDFERYEIHVPVDDTRAMFRKAEQEALRLSCPAWCAGFPAQMCKGSTCIPICQFVPHMTWLRSYYADTRTPTTASLVRVE